MNIFITGGTTGIGKQLALDYVKQGHRVGICGRSSEKYTKDLEETEGIRFYKADVFYQGQIQQVVDQFVKENGSLDIFYANAGIGAGRKVKEPKIERDKQVTDINVTGFLNSMAAALSHMIKQKSGKIITVSSLGALFGLPGNAAYCASKAFVRTYSESMAIDLKQFGITLTCVLPGYIRTPLTMKNNHPMPFLMDVEKATELIRKAVKKGKHYYGFPWIFSSACHTFGALPKIILYWVLGKIRYR